MFLACLRPAIAALGLAVALSAGTAAGAWTFSVCADPDAAPYSARDGGGFDNRIAAAIADALGAELEMVWMPDHRARTLLRHLHGGACDAAMGMLDGSGGVLTSHAYYRTGYTFVHPEAAGIEVASLDDPVLRALRIGLPGGARKPTPPSLALARRGMLDNLQHFEAPARGAASEIGVALRQGSIDLAILWGPVAGALAQAEGGLVVAPVQPEIDVPFLPMVGSFAIGVRPHDEALRDAIDVALAERWDEVQSILTEAGVPLWPLPRPLVQAEASQ